MITRVKNGQGFRGLLDYLYGDYDNRGELRTFEPKMIGGTILGHNPETVAAGFAAVRAQRPGRQDMVRHISFQLSPEDKRAGLNTEGMQARIAERLTDEIGMSAYHVVSHGDDVHIVGSVYGFNGEKIADSYLASRIQQIAREIEQEEGLQQLESSEFAQAWAARQAYRENPTDTAAATLEEAEHKAANADGTPTPGEIALYNTYGQVSEKQRVEVLLDRAAEQSNDLATYLETAETLGLDVQPNIQSTGRVSGYSVALPDGEKTFKASGLRSKAFTVKGLETRGIMHDPGNSEQLERIRRIGSRFGSGEIYHGPAPGNQGSLATRGGTDRTTAFAGSEHSEAPGRQHPATGAGVEQLGSENSAGSYSAATVRTEPEAPAGARGDRGEEHGNRGEEHTERRQGGAKGAAGAARDPLEDLVASRAGGGWNRGTIDLGRLAAADKRDLRYEGKREAERIAAKAGDLTARQVLKFIDALNVDWIDVNYAPRHQPGEPKAPAGRDNELTPDDLMRQLPTLKRNNALNSDPFIRTTPDEDGKMPPVAMIDDLDAQSVHRLDQDIGVAAVVETSPGSYQAWVKLREDGQRIDKAEVGRIREYLRWAYDGDPDASKAAEQAARLPGLTNRKPKHLRPDGKQPFAVCRHADGTVPSAETLENLITEVKNYERKHGLQRDQGAVGPDRAEAGSSLGATAAGPGRGKPDVGEAGSYPGTRRQRGQSQRGSGRQADRGAAVPGDGELGKYLIQGALQQRAQKRLQENAPARFREALASAGRSTSDRSRQDYRAAMDLARSGFSESWIAFAIEQESPDLRDRHSNPRDYAERTAQKAADAARKRRHLAADRANAQHRHHRSGPVNPEPDKTLANAESEATREDYDNADEPEPSGPKM